MEKCPFRFLQYSIRINLKLFTWRSRKQCTDLMCSRDIIANSMRNQEQRYLINYSANS
jgi:hypothetical protein